MTVLKRIVENANWIQLLVKFSVLIIVVQEISILKPIVRLVRICIRSQMENVWKGILYVTILIVGNVIWIKWIEVLFVRMVVLVSMIFLVIVNSVWMGMSLILLEIVWKLTVWIIIVRIVWRMMLAKKFLARFLVWIISISLKIVRNAWWDSKRFLKILVKVKEKLSKIEFLLVFFIGIQCSDYNCDECKEDSPGNIVCLNSCKQNFDYSNNCQTCLQGFYKNQLNEC